MGGVLGGIGKGLLDLLGGAYALKRQETEGYDWREKAAQAEFQRQQEREQAQLQNEAAQLAQDEKLKGQLADVLAGSGEGEQPDLESLLPQNIENLRRQRIIKGALGAGKERKSALQAQKLQADAEREQIRQRGRMEALTKTQEFQDAQQEERIAAAREGRQASLDNALKRTEMMIEARKSGGGGGGGRGGYAKPIVDAQGNVKGWYNSKVGPEGQVQILEGPTGIRTSPQSAAQQEAGVQAAGQMSSLDRIAELYNPDWVGPIASREYSARAAIPGLPEPEPNRAEFVALTAGLQNAGIKAITGAQMSEHEVPRLMRELPTDRDKPSVFEAKMKMFRRRIALLDAVRRGQISREDAIAAINSGGPGASPKPAAPKRRLKFNPATGALE